jgi:hypothetical protein
MGLFVFLQVGCMTPNLARLKDTPRDRERLNKINLDNAAFENAHVVVLTNANSALGKAYKDAINSSTNKMLIKMGGVTVVDRSHIDFALKEAIFQESGVVDVSRIQLGQFKGADHLVTSGLTGASASQEYYPAQKICSRNGKCQMSEPYWKNVVEVSVRINVINLQTLEILADEDISNKYTKSSRSQLGAGGFFQLLSEALAYCFEDAKPALQKAFPVRGLLIAMKGDKSVAMISLGAGNKIQKGRIFDVMAPIQQETAIGVINSYSKIGKCSVFQVESDSSWCSLGGDKDSIKIGMEVHARPEEVSYLRKFARIFQQFVTVH